MTPIWNEEIERIKQDPDASVFLVSFTSQTEAKSTLHKLSFARQMNKEGKTALALPGHIVFKVGKSSDGTLWVLLAGRLSTDESMEAYEIFGIYGGEQMIVIPSQVQSRILDIATAPTEIAPPQEPAGSTLSPSEIKDMPEPVVAKAVQELSEINFTPFVAAPAPKPIEAALTKAPAAVTKTQESTVVAPAKAPVNVVPATAPVVINAPQGPSEIEPVFVVAPVAQALPKVAPFQERDDVAPMRETLRISPIQDPIVAKPLQEPAEIKFTPFVAAPAPKPIEVVSPQSPIAVTKVQESTVLVPARTPAKITPATAPVVANAPQTPIEIKPVAGVVPAAHALPKIAPVQEPDGVVSVQEPAKVSPVQKVILPKPDQGPANAKASPSPAESSLTSIAAKVAPPEPAKGVSPQSPAKVMPRPVVAAAPSPKEAKPASMPITPPSDDQPATRIYLAKEGAREGPFTLEHINAEIIAKRYRDDDYWAWHDGLPEWIPLYKLSGVYKPAKA